MNSKRLAEYRDIMISDGAEVLLSAVLPVLYGKIACPWPIWFMLCLAPLLMAIFFDQVPDRIRPVSLPCIVLLPCGVLRIGAAT
jgi:hypothetical protein